jgi:hypothetical protein
MGLCLPLWEAARRGAVWALMASAIAGGLSAPFPGSRRGAWFRAVGRLPGEPTESFFNAPARPERCDASVRDYGARGDDDVDDTAAFNDAIWYLTPGTTLCVPPGIYLIDAVKSVHLKSRMTLWMWPGVVLRAQPTSEPQYAILKVWKHSDVIIYGGTLEGERDRHLGTSGEWGMGIDVRGASRVTIRRVTIRGCWGDGILIDGFDDKTMIDPATDSTLSEDVDVVDVTADRNRRQRISLVSGRNVAVIGSRLLNTRGTGPAAGIDIEPDLPSQTVENVHLIDLQTENNQGPGIMVLLHQLEPTAFSTITVDRHTDRGSSRGLYLHAPRQTGQIHVASPDWTRSKRATEIHRSCSMELTVTEPRPSKLKWEACRSPGPTSP